jgi:hypothetical protein
MEREHDGSIASEYSTNSLCSCTDGQPVLCTEDDDAKRDQKWRTWLTYGEARAADACCTKGGRPPVAASVAVETHACSASQLSGHVLEEPRWRWNCCEKSKDRMHAGRAEVALEVHVQRDGRARCWRSCM